MLATVMVVSFTAGVFASCSYGLDQEQKKKDEGYEYTVTYDANGGEGEPYTQIADFGTGFSSVCPRCSAVVAKL